MRDGKIRLPDNHALIREYHRVRGRFTQSGRESIDAPGRGVDDRVSAVVMACGVAFEDLSAGGWVENMREYQRSTGVAPADREQVEPELRIVYGKHADGREEATGFVAGKKVGVARWTAGRVPSSFVQEMGASEAFLETLFADMQAKGMVTES
jgi:hypothetical protein